MEPFRTGAEGIELGKPGEERPEEMSVEGGRSVYGSSHKKQNFFASQSRVKTTLLEKKQGDRPPEQEVARCIRRTEALRDGLAPDPATPLRWKPVRFVINLWHPSESLPAGILSGKTIHRCRKAELPRKIVLPQFLRQAPSAAAAAIHEDIPAASGM